MAEHVGLIAEARDRAADVEVPTDAAKLLDRLADALEAAERDTRETRGSDG